MNIRAQRRFGIAATAALAFVIVLPIAVTILGAFSGSDWYGPRSEGASVATTSALFSYVWTIWGGALFTSLKIVAVVVPAALAIGVPAAYAFRRHPFPGSPLLERVALSALSIPGVVLAFALIQAAGARPRLALLAAGHLLYTLPLVLKTVGSTVETIDPELEAAARTLGAGRWTVIRRVVLPLLGPAIALSALMVFTVSWGEFNVSYVLASPLVQVYPAALYATYTTNSFPVAAAATLIFLIPAVPALLMIQAVAGDSFARGIPA